MIPYLTPPSRLLALLAAVGAVCTVLLAAALHAAPAGAEGRLKVSGPRTVEVGERAAFVARGLHPGERVDVSLAPTLHRGGNCCGITVVRGAEAGSRGAVRLRFRWPRHYFNGSERVRWRHRSRVDVIVISDHARALRVIRVLRL